MIFGLILLIMMFGIGCCEAGMDFTHWGNDEAMIHIPSTFNNENEALRWANESSGSGDTSLPDRLLSKWIAIYNQYMTSLTVPGKPDALFYTDQVFYFEKALQIIYWKDKAMTSEEFYKGIVIPWFNSNHEIEAWVNSLSSTEATRRLLIRRICDLRNRAHAFSIELTSNGILEAGNLMDQVEKCEKALCLIKSVGSVVYASSVPWASFI